MGASLMCCRGAVARPLQGRCDLPHVPIELAVVDRASLDLATLASRVGPGASAPRLYGRSVSYSTSGMLSDQLGCPVRLAPQAVMSENPITPSTRDSVQGVDHGGYRHPDATTPGQRSAVGLRLP